MHSRTCIHCFVWTKKDAFSE